MQRILFSLLWVSVVALGDCGEPQFETRCVVTQVVGPGKLGLWGKDIKGCIRKVKIGSGEELSLVFQVTPQHPCPEAGARVTGNLQIPCNDTGPKTYRPPTFDYVEDLKACVQEYAPVKAAREFRYDVFEASMITVTDYQISKETENIDGKDVFSWIQQTCLMPSFKERELKLGKEYAFKIRFDLNPAPDPMPFVRDGVSRFYLKVENVKVTESSKGFPATTIKCIENIPNLDQLYSHKKVVPLKVSGKAKFGKIRH